MLLTPSVEFRVSDDLVKFVFQGLLNTSGKWNCSPNCFTNVTVRDNLSYYINCGTRRSILCLLRLNSAKSTLLRRGSYLGRIPGYVLVAVPSTARAI